MSRAYLLVFCVALAMVSTGCDNLDLFPSETGEATRVQGANVTPAREGVPPGRGLATAYLDPSDELGLEITDGSRIVRYSGEKSNDGLLSEITTIEHLRAGSPDRSLITVVDGVATLIRTRGAGTVAISPGENGGTQFTLALNGRSFNFEAEDLTWTGKRPLTPELVHDSNDALSIPAESPFASLARKTSGGAQRIDLEIECDGEPLSTPSTDTVVRLQFDMGPGEIDRFYSRKGGRVAEGRFGFLLPISARDPFLSDQDILDHYDDCRENPAGSLSERVLLGTCEYVTGRPELRARAARELGFASEALFQGACESVFQAANTNGELTAQLCNSDAFYEWAFDRGLNAILSVVDRGRLTTTFYLEDDIMRWKDEGLRLVSNDVSDLADRYLMEMDGDCGTPAIEAVDLRSERGTCTTNEGLPGELIAWDIRIFDRGWDVFPGGTFETFSLYSDGTSISRTIQIPTNIDEDFSKTVRLTRCQFWGEATYVDITATVTDTRGLSSTASFGRTFQVVST